MGKDEFVLIAAGGFLAYLFFCRRGGPHIPADVIPLDEPAVLQWAETHGAMFLTGGYHA